MANKKNTKVKGNLHEKTVRQIYEKRGYLTEKCMPLYVYVRGRMIATRHDFFGAFDLITTHPEHGTEMVQVTDQNNWSAHIPKITKYDWHRGLIISGWCWHDGRRTFDKRYNDKKMFTLNQVYSYYTLNHETKEFEFQHYVDKEGKVIYKEDYQEYCKKEHVKRYAKKVGE